MAAIAGAFEAHVTVSGAAPGALAAFSAAHGLAHVEIELAAGAHAAQPMTSSRHRGALADVRREVDALATALAAAGFVVARVKLEADVDNDGVGEVAGGYFEAHVKLRDGGAAAPAIAAAHGARMSRNARRPGERFATLRAYGTGPAGRAAFDAQVDAVARAFGADVLAVSREYVVYDSRVELDAGWLEPPA